MYSLLIIILNGVFIATNLIITSPEIAFRAFTFQPELRSGF